MTRVAAALAAVLVVGILTKAAHTQTPVIIHGHVVAGDTGDPLVHARVVVFNDATPLPPIFTDAQGRFASALLPQGRYRLTATKAGYAVTSVPRFGGTPADDVTVRMPRASALAGRVLDRFGEPAAGVQMQLFIRAPDRTKLGLLVKTTSTDDLGEYRFGGLAEGTYVVAAMTLQGDGTGRVDRSASYYPGVAGVADAQDFTLRPGDDKLGVDFSGIGTQQTDVTVSMQIVTPPVAVIGPNGQRITPAPVAGTSVIRGRVTRSDGLPIAHATVSTQVQQTLLGRPFNGSRSVQSDENGQYEITELPAGQYRVTAAKLGFMTFSYGQRADEDRGALIDIGASETRTRIDVVLPRYSNVMGRVVDEFGDPVENAAVTLSQIKYQGGRRRLVSVSAMSGRTSDDLGRYRVYAVPPGDYVVSASVGQVVAFQSGTGVSGYALTYFPNTSEPRQAQLVSVPRAQDVAGVDFVLVPTPTATVSGKKLGWNGQPFGGSLTLTTSQRSGAIVTPPAGARIYDDGRFEFPNVAPGEYVIQGQEGQSGPGREGQFASAFVTVNGADVPDVLLQATPGSTVSGRVVFEGDGPTVPSLTIMTSRADFDRTPNSTAQGDVGADLRFAMTGIRGPRRIAVGRLPAGWMLKSVTVGGVDVTDVPLPFGSPDQSLDDVEVVLTSQITELSGTVVDTRGDVSSEYSLLVFPADRDRWYPGSRYFRRAGPASGGTFSVRGLPPSDYYVAPVAGWAVLKDGGDAWQDPEFLESVALRATRATLTEGGRVALAAKLITR